MGSVKFKDLKAYVRYDGNGRVVAGSMVFRKKKPKNGRWYEISSNLCCNAGPNPGTTTTTTTQGGGGVISTAFTRTYWTNRYNSCTTTTEGEITFYSASPILTAGITLYVDAALTIPLYQGWVINDAMAMTRYEIAVGGVISVSNCNGIVQVLASTDSGTVCAYGGNSITITYDAGVGFCNVSSISSNNFSTYFNAYDIIYVSNPEASGYRMFSVDAYLTTATPILGSCSSC